MSRSTLTNGVDATATVAQLHGAQMAYRRWSGEGDPVVLVHGVGDSMRTWGELPVALASAGRAVIAVDLLGHGQSDRGNGDLSLGGQANALRDLFDHLQVTRAHMVGHSLGGGVCLQFAYQYSERVSSMTLIDSGGLGREVNTSLRAATLPGSRFVIHAITSPGVTDKLRALARGLDRAGLPQTGLTEHIVDTLSNLHEPERMAGFVDTLRTVIGLDGQRISALGHQVLIDPRRTLIVWGVRDVILPVTHGEHLHELLPGSSLLLVPAAGHSPHLDNPEMVARAILDHTGAGLPMWSAPREVLLES